MEDVFLISLYMPNVEKKKILQLNLKQSNSWFSWKYKYFCSLAFDVLNIPVDLILLEAKNNIWGIPVCLSVCLSLYLAVSYYNAMPLKELADLNLFVFSTCIRIWVLSVL